ncbi:MAG: hypothetical protein JNK85_00115 [Verrucomicrobiales bacterium]|nr:hypothetical protein [Verrucomicrobiales bacterium]
MNQQPGLSRRGFLSRAAAGGVVAGWSTQGARAAVQPASAENPWRYDVDQLRKVDPALIRFEPVRQFPVGHAAARRVVFGRHGRLFVAAGKSVLALGPEGQRESAWDVGEQVRCLRVDDAGAVWIGVKDRVLVFDANGERTARWDAFAGKAYLTGLTVTERDVWVADSGNRVVYRCDRKGRLELRLGERSADRKVPGLVLPSPFLDIEAGADGLLRVNNAGRHRVEVYTRDGDLEQSWGRPGVAIDSFCGCCNPIGLALLPDGRCLTAEKGLPRVKVYSAAGEFESVVAGPASFAAVGSAEREQTVAETAHDGLDVAVDGEGRIAVLDLVGGTLHLFRSKA